MNHQHHLPRGLPNDDVYGGMSSNTATASIPYTEEIIAQSHHRTHSSDHITFPKFPVPPPAPAAATTPTHSNSKRNSSNNNNNYYNATHASEPHHSIISLQSRSASMPTAPGGASKEKERETYTLSDRTSTLLQVTGQIPPPLIGSTTVIHNKQMLLFGGRQEGGEPSNDLYVLDLDTLVWELVDLLYHQRQAASRSHTQSTPSSMEERHHPLSPDNTQRIGESDLGLTSLAYTASIPKPRYYHSAVVVPAPPLFDAQGVLTGWGDENAAQMVVFGGRCFEDDGVHETCLNDTHILDLTTLQWVSTSLNSAEFQHTRSGLQQPQQRSALETSSFLDLPLLNTGTDKVGNFGSVDSGHGSMEPSTLVANLAALTPADMSFQAGQFSQSRRETPPIRSATATPSTFTGTPSSFAGTPVTTQQATPQSMNSPFSQHTPRPRFAHVASLNGDHMVIFGGRTHDNAAIQEISVLDLARRVWMIGGEFHGQCCQRISSLAGVEERPMARRRRRHLECLAGDQQPLEQSSSTSTSTAALSSSSSSSSLSSANTSANSSAALPRLPSTAMPPMSPNATSFLLNPRKNSWHRGEGHPFDLLPVNTIPRHRFKSDSLLSGMEQDDAVWLQSGKSQNPAGVTKKHGLVGLGMDPEISQAMAVSAGLPMTNEDAVARARQPSVGSTKSSQTTTSKGSKMSAQEAARKRSQSQSSSSASIPTTPPVPSPGSRPRTKAPVTHAVSKKFFAKSNGGLMDFEDLATTIAREAKVRPPVRPKVISVTRSRRSSASTTSSSGSARRGSAATDDSRKTGKTDGKSEKSTMNDSRSNLNDSRSNINDSKRNINDSKSNVNESKSHVNDLKSEKRKSLGSALDTVALSGISLADTLESTEQAAATASQKLLRPALYLFSNYMGTTMKPRQELVKVQASKTATCTKTELDSYDIKPEWTGSYVSDLATRMLASTELAAPPQMLFPESHIVDHCFLLSGSAVPSTAAGSTSSTSKATGKPTSGLSHSAENLGQDTNEGATVFSCSDPKTLFSVWMFHFKTHQWTQLELSKSLCAGEWKQSVLDREGNYLYLIGTGIKDPQQELAGLDLARQPSSSASSSAWAPTAFTHMVKVDLEGFGICPEIDEASMGTNGAKLGLVMLRDGLGADVVLVSSTDGGRVRVNSAMVGQRWGYFQNLMKDRESKIKHDSTYPQGPRDEDARLLELTDLPAEILVRESMPILVAFLQYVYTNELATAHQLKLKSLQGLLMMSHRYDLTRLRQLVLRALHHQLDVNNAPAICEVAVLASEFGLQTCALRVLLQNARQAQFRQQGEAAEAKRRLDFAMSRLDEIEEERKRRVSVPANHSLHGAAAAAATAAAAAAASASGGASSSGIPRGKAGSSAIFTGQAAPLRSGSGPSSTTTSNTSTPGLGSIGRFFRHREESVDLEH